MRVSELTRDAAHAGARYPKGTWVITMDQEYAELVRQLDEGDGVLVLTDIYGATPGNIALKLLLPGRVEGVSGVNLPMLIRVLTYREQGLAAAVEKALSGGTGGVIHMTKDACNGTR